MKKFGGKTRAIAITVIVAAIAGSIWMTNYLIFTFSHESTDDAFINAHIVQISPRVDGHVSNVYVSDNQWVKKGDLLVELDSRDFQAGLDIEAASLAAAEALLKQSQAQIAAVRAEAVEAEKDLNRYEALFDSNSGVSRQRLDSAATAA